MPSNLQRTAAVGIGDAGILIAGHQFDNWRGI
jgi:hypothetical protein